MKKLILATSIFLTTISTANAQPTLGEATNNPIVIRAITPLVSCEEFVIRENLFLPRYDKRIWSLISDDCESQIRDFLEACELVTDYGADDCGTITDNLLRRRYTVIVNDMLREEKGY